MTDIMQNRTNNLQKIIQQNGWGIMNDKEIGYGHQYIITDGASQVPVNIYTTGIINVQGKDSDLKSKLQEWTNLELSGISDKRSQTQFEDTKSRTAKFLVIPTNRSIIRDEVIPIIPAEIVFREAMGAAEEYRVEIRDDISRVTVTQYESGTLMIQGVSSPLFEQVCEVLDEHLVQTFSDRAARFIPGNKERQAASAYLDLPESENEAVQWLTTQIDRKAIDFLYPNDQQTLAAAAGVRNAVRATEQDLPDYSVIVMPFAKAYEGFLIKLSAHLKIVNEDNIRQRADSIEIGGWLETIKRRIPDQKRYAEICNTLDAAWGCRNKAIHSDPGHPLSVLANYNEAEQEIITILRAIGRTHRLFVVEGIELGPEKKRPQTTQNKKTETEKFKDADVQGLQERLIQDGIPIVIQTQGRDNLWEYQSETLLVVAPSSQPGLIIVKGSDRSSFVDSYQRFLKPIQPNTPPRNSDTSPQIWIGVDESGKGDLFGPLVVAGVAITPDLEIQLARLGVRDSKTLSDKAIFELDFQIKEFCAIDLLILSPPEYNDSFPKFGNLNKLLAWGHAYVIKNLVDQTQANKAISDQFGDEQLLIQALADNKCTVILEQRPKAESEIAVAAASIVARAAFRCAIDEYETKSGIKIPIGSSSPNVIKIGKLVYNRWGRNGLERIAKMHFKTINAIIDGE